MDFLADSGASITSIPMVTAQKAHLEVPTRTVDLDVRTVIGKFRQRVHPGHITVRIPGLEGREFLWPCHSTEHADEPPPALLGLTGVIDDVDIGFTGDYALEARYGWLVLRERLEQEGA